MIARPPESQDLVTGLGDLTIDESALFAGVEDGSIAVVVSVERGVEEETDEVSDELIRVSRRISGQVAEVIGRTVARLYAEPALGAKPEELLAATDALRRLAVVTGDTAQVTVLDELRAELALAQERGGKAARQRLLVRVRAWIPRYTLFLDPVDRERLERLVAVDAGASPLYRDLEAIPGVGRRRLERLWAAGLYQPEQVAGSDPEDLASVTGLPRPLAAEVVRRARAFLREAPRRFVGEVRDRLRHLQALTVPDRADDALAEEVRAALADLQQVLDRFGTHGGVR